MALRIGEVYRYSSQGKDEGSPSPFMDHLPNFYYETYCEGLSTITFQKGIHQIAKVKTIDGEQRIPAIIISSSPHKARTDTTPWEDDFNPDYGHIKYYGDNKSPAQPADKAPGNDTLLKMFFLYSSPDAHIRKNAPPLLFFKRVEYDGRKKGNLLFQGFGIIESVELITQFDPRLKTPYFTNYVFDMCVFSLNEENEEFSWEWINARRNSRLSCDDTLRLAPKSWRKWVAEGSTSLYKFRRSVSVGRVIPEKEQRPEKASKEDETLQRIYSYYQDKKHVFELLAMRVAQEVFEEDGISFHPGWITNKSGDRGIDFVARIDISAQMSSLKIVVLGQAKCEKLDAPTNGIHIARTVARLKRGWFGVYVTTSYFSRNVQLEVMDDQYPIMLICGKKLAETVNKLIFKRGITLEAFLEEINTGYQTETRRAEDILAQ